MKVKLTKEDLRIAKKYESNTDCILCQALKRRFPYSRVFAGSRHVIIGKKSYSIAVEDVDKVLHAYNGKLPVTINLLR